MTKRLEIDKSEQFTARVHRQHSSLVITLPKRMCSLMAVDKGDIIVFVASWDPNLFFIEKLTPRGKPDAGNN